MKSAIIYVVKSTVTLTTAHPAMLKSITSVWRAIQRSDWVITPSVTFQVPHESLRELSFAYIHLNSVFYHCLLLKQEANVSLTGDAFWLQTYIVFTAVCRSRGGAHLISSANSHTRHPAAFNSNKNTDNTVFSFGDCVHIYAALLITRSHAFELIVFSISVWHGGVHVWSLRWTPAEGWRSVLYRIFFWNSL